MKSIIPTRSKFIVFISLILILLILTGCGPNTRTLEAVEYTPLTGDDWAVSTPAEQGLDPKLVAEFYHNAAKLDTIYSLLVIKDGYLIAEKYFNDGSLEQTDLLASVTKSLTSALVGIALEQEYLTSVDQKMIDFFPEIANQITDPRKNQITIREMLQMRAGYPWEESHPALWEGLLTGHYPPLIKEFPLIADPGTEFHYSNLTSMWLGIIVDRASGTSLSTFSEEHLFSQIDVEAGEWWQDAEDHNNGAGDLHLTARDMAKFGLLYLNDGVYDGKQIISADWVSDSLQTYSEDAWEYRVGPNFNDIGYGYQWWSAKAGDHRYNLAWGHGGQQIVLLDDFNMVIVLTAYPLYLEHNDRAWKHEKANVSLVADFIASLPIE